MLKRHGRYDYSPITRRPDYTWPNGARLAVYIALNVEQYGFDEGLVEDLVPGGSKPDVLNTSWREYGSRVGAWRLLDLFRSLDLPATILLNSELCEHSPELVTAFHDAGHEIAAHGRTNSESQAGLGEADEVALIRKVTDTIGAAAGEPPAGWLSPWLAETYLTPDLLGEAGYRYVLDWCADDQPIWLNTRGGRILAIPYSQEINDSAAIIGRFVSASDFADMVIDQVDEMLEQSEPLVFGLAIHANIVGQPFRLRQLRRALSHIAGLSDQIWVTRARDIAAHIHDHPERAV
ncbi:MAG: polysaccharide deacetylase family protein [Chloroflexi bacterium]|nr:polysaccharide deacetylase family protein [Chloroflexota bacterium]